MMVPGPRRVGIRYDGNQQPLLKTVGGRPTGRKPPDPIAWDAEPISCSSGSDDDGPSKRADITSTVFGSESTAGSARPKNPTTTRISLDTRDGRRTRRSAAAIASDSPSPASSKRSLGLDNDIDSPPYTRPAKKRKEGTSSDDDSHRRFKEMTSAFRPQAQKSTAKYGNQRSVIQSKKAASMEARGTRAREPSVSSPEQARRFIRHNEGALGKSPSTSPIRSLKIPERVEEDVSDGSPRRRRTAKPPVARKARGFVKPSAGALGESPSASPNKPMKIPKRVEGEVSDGSPRRRRPTKPSVVRKTRGGAKKLERREISPEQGSPMAVFKMPSVGMVDLGADFDLGPIDATPDNSGSDAEGPTSPARGDGVASSQGAVCPMCNERVDRELLDRFTKDRRMTIAQQQKFCQDHKLKSARDTWTDKGYPDIDWYQLETRISKHHGILKDILRGGASHYGDRFARKVKAGKSKTVLKTKQSLTPGYYGIRGLRLMTEDIIKRFSSLLREQAVRDRLVSARGHTAYVQAVLVPELTVRLIMEDMDVSEEEARSILQASIWIGDLLNEEDGDVVPNEDEDDTDPLSCLSVMSDNEVTVLE